MLPPISSQAETARAGVHGRIDALVQHGHGSIVVYEVKSVRSLCYLKEPFPRHLEQLQFYLNVLGVECGRLDYVDRSALLAGTGGKVDACFPVERDVGAFTGLLEKAGVFHQFLVQRVAPPHETCWLCKYCLHKDACV